MGKRPFIFFCDDKPKWTNIFKERHEGSFDIKTTNDSNNFLKDLEDLVKRGQTPDIILIDLYHPKYFDDKEKQAKLNLVGDAAIERLEAAIKAENSSILEAWNPLGYFLLERARKMCPHTPIAIYTEQGLTLAGNDELDRVSKANGEWFLKGTEGIYENDRLKRMLNANLYTQTTKNTLWFLSAVIIIAALAYSLIVKRELDYTVSFGATLVSLAIAVMPRIISYLVRKKQK
jgi:hypothetical protein